MLKVLKELSVTKVLKETEDLQGLKGPKVPWEVQGHKERLDLVVPPVHKGHKELQVLKDP